MSVLRYDHKRGSWYIRLCHTEDCLNKAMGNDFYCTECTAVEIGDMSAVSWVNVNHPEEIAFTPVRYDNPHVKPRRYWFFEEIWGIIGKALGEGCGWECGYEEPYGWVPEAHCPIHDSERWWHGPLLRVITWIVN